jgi:hypothetical protein
VRNKDSSFTWGFSQTNHLQVAFILLLLSSISAMAPHELR